MTDNEYRLVSLRTVGPHYDVNADLTIHRIGVVFARKSDTKIDKNTLEVSTKNLEDYFIDFYVGMDMNKFSKYLRNLADAIDAHGDTA